MSTDAVTPEMRNARMTEFIRLLPLTIELAGLPAAAPGAVLTADMMEGRAMSIRTAYRIARNLIKEVGETGA